ncbi:MAG: aminotransferase class V-fold PLP-dependent enzyme [Bacillota bacterium]|nr:aminotransferase class V-fold PLP-dependent enzyme [Bacillota bacterium]
MIKFLLNHASKNPVSFHMPGHKGTDIFRRYGYGDFLDRFVDCDITEIPGADNLFQAEGIIMETQNKYRDLYGVKNSYLMINGTSGGIIASILATVKPGNKLIMARNCHKSVFNGLTLGNIQPVYARPELIEEHGILGRVTPEEIQRCIDENPDADAVILPSPNYYGICSDIEKIAEVVHKAGKVLIVDQAHGAHLEFFQKFGCGDAMPKSAEASGADLVINSIHKTLASLTQSAVLNLNSDRVDRYTLEDKIQAIESTSPSYVLMSFLDMNADLLLNHGREAMSAWRDNLDYFYAKARNIEGLKLLQTEDMDFSKINIDSTNLGIDGGRLEELLMERGIYTELHTGNILMLMTGIGNTREHMDRTLSALAEISGSLIGKDNLAQADRLELNRPTIPQPGKLHSIPRDKEYVPLDKGVGRICAGSLIPYPPGIPAICPGEEIEEDMVEYILDLRRAGEKVIGINDRGEILVGRD